MKKRRWVVVGLTLAMLLGTVGCGAEKEDSADWTNAIDKETDDEVERETNAFNRMVAQLNGFATDLKTILPGRID